MTFKIDIHNHILPERWPDLKEVRAKSDELLTPMLASCMRCLRVSVPKDHFKRSMAVFILEDVLDVQTH